MPLVLLDTENLVSAVVSESSVPSTRLFSLVTSKYQLVFDVEPWFAARAERNFYEDVQISFRVDDPEQHYHVPLLLSPFGYSTYRGS